eukprot:Clim_evm136s157 gene=Clim_evmTU136s157
MRAITALMALVCLTYTKEVVASVECSPGCTKAMLGNGFCEVECNSPNCEHDNGDCKCSCDSGMLDNEECDPECNHPGCWFDRGRCYSDDINVEGCPIECDLYDSQCDYACNTPDCRHDNGSCRPPLQCPEECTAGMLGNGICDIDCNSEGCGFDNDDCTWPNTNECWYDCPFHMRGDATCQWACNNERCEWDGGDCAEASNAGMCAPGCTQDMQINADCDPECFNQACGYDNGNCDHSPEFTPRPACSPECSEWKLNNGVCDPECNTFNCGWDNRDCLCGSQRCNIQDWGNRFCNQECNSDVCNFDGGDCQVYRCAPGCLPANEGDSICQEACNVAECDYDHGDCDASGCSAACLVVYGNFICDEECNVPECQFDGDDCEIPEEYVSYCDPDLRCRSDMVNNGMCDSACAGVPDCAFDGDDCSVAGGFADTCEEVTLGQCRVDMRGNSICDNWCNNAECNYDEEDCNGIANPWCAPLCDDFSGMNKDYVCQAACNVEACDYDNGVCEENPFADIFAESDFECAKGCNFNWIGDGICQDTCNNALCLFDNFDCAVGNYTDLTGALGFDLGLDDCPLSCKINWLGDSVCDPECASADCQWDLGDCLVNEIPERRDCVLSEWVPVLSDNNKRQCNTGVQPLCGEGTSLRSRQILKPTVGDGIPCPADEELTESVSCDLGKCPEVRTFCDRPNTFCPSQLPGPRLSGEFMPRNLGLLTESGNYDWAQQTLNTPISSLSVSSKTTTVFKMAGAPLMLPGGRSMVYGVLHFAEQRAIDGSDKVYTIPLGYTLEFAFLGGESVAMVNIELDDYANSFNEEAYRQFAPKWPPPQPRMLDDGRVFALVPGGSMLVTTSFTTNPYTAVTVERYDLISMQVVPLTNKILWAEADVSEFACSTSRLCFVTLVQRMYAPRLIRVEFVGVSYVDLFSQDLAQAADPSDLNPYECRIASGPSVITLASGDTERVMIQACGQIAFYDPANLLKKNDAEATVFDAYVSGARNEMEVMSSEWYKYVDFRLYPLHLVHQSAYLSRSDKALHYAIQGVAGVSWLRSLDAIDIDHGFSIFADQTLSSTFTAATALPSGACMLGTLGIQCGLWDEENPSDTGVQDRLTSSTLRFCPDCATIPRFTSNPIATNYKSLGISLSDHAIKVFNLKDFSQEIQAAELTDGLIVSGLLNSLSLPVGSKSLLPSPESDLLPAEIERINGGQYGVQVDYRVLAGHRLRSAVSTLNNVMYVTAPYIVSEDAAASTSSRKITKSAMVSVSAGCRPGDYYNAQFSTCTSCPPGAISPSYNVMASCQVCPPGTVAVGGSRCKPCPRGQYQVSDGDSGLKTCESCPEGFECPYGAPAPLRRPTANGGDVGDTPSDTPTRKRRATAPGDTTAAEDTDYGYYSASTETDFSTESNRPGEAAKFKNHTYMIVGGTAALVALIVIILLKALPDWTAEKLVLLHILAPRRIEHTIEFDESGKLFSETLVKTSIRGCFSMLAVFLVALAWLNLLADYIFENVVITRTFVAASAEEPGAVDSEGLSLDNWAPLTAIVTFAFYVTPSSADTSTLDCVLTTESDTSAQFIRPANAPASANWTDGCYYDGAGNLLGSVQVSGSWETDRAAFDLELRACSILSASRVTFLANSPVESEPTSYSEAIRPPDDFVYTVDRSDFDTLKLNIQSQFHRSRFVSFGKHFGGITAESGYKVEAGFTVDAAAVTLRADSVTDVSQQRAPMVEFVLLQNNLEYKTTVTRKTNLTALIGQMSAIASTILIVMVVGLDGVELFWEWRAGKEAVMVQRSRKVMRRSLGIIDDPNPRCVRKSKRVPSHDNILTFAAGGRPSTGGNDLYSVEDDRQRQLDKAAQGYEHSNPCLYDDDGPQIPAWLSNVPGQVSATVLGTAGLKALAPDDGLKPPGQGDRRNSTSCQASSRIGMDGETRDTAALTSDTSESETRDTAALAKDDSDSE